MDIPDLRPLSPQVIQLFNAVSRGDKDETARLLRLGIPINDLDPSTTDSPLMVACRRGYPDLVQLCLDYGAKNDPHPDFGQTALHACVASVQRDCAAVLLKVAAESEADDLICNLTDQNGQTPLHTSAVVGSAALAELLLSHGASLGALDAFGQTPLHLAAGASAAGAVECLALLLVQGGDDPSLLDLPDVFGNTPLHHAAYHGRLECARLLLQSAADVSLRNAKNLTAYNLATTQGHHPLALLLLDYRDQHFVSPRKALSSTPSHRSARTVWSTPLQSASKQSIRATPSHHQQFSTPLTSDRHSGRHLPHGQAGRTFMDTEIEEPDDTADASQVIVAFSGRASTAEKSARSVPRDEALLPRPHTLSHSSPSATLSKSTRTPSAVIGSASASGGTGANSSQSTSRLDSVDLPLRRQSPLRQQARVASQPAPSTASSAKAYFHEEVYSDASRGQEQRAVNGAVEDDPFELEVDPALESEAYEYAYEDVNGAAESFVPPLEEFDCLNRRWAAYCTEDGFTYFLCSIPGSSEAHSQWEDPRTHGFVAADDYYSNNDAAVTDGVEETPKSFSPRGSPPRSSVSQSPSPQRQPPLSPALRSPAIQRSPASLLTTLSFSRTEESKVDEEDVALALADVNEFDRTVDLDDAVDVAVSGKTSRSPSARPKASPVARTIDWDKETTETEELNATDPSAAPSQRRHVTRAAILSPISSDDDSDLDRSVEVRVVSQRSRRPAKGAVSTNASVDAAVPAAQTVRVQSNKLRDQRSWMRPTTNDDSSCPAVVVNDGADINLAALSPTRATLLTLDYEPSDGAVEDQTDEASASSQLEQEAERAQAEIDKAQLVEDCAREIAARPDDLAVLQRVRRRLEEDLLLPQETIKAVMARADELALASAPAEAEVAATQSAAPARSEKATNKQEDLQARLQVALSDEVLGKFAKMARMGVPPQSVMMKMALDKVSAADQRRMQVVLGLVEEASPGEDGEKDKMSRVIVALPEERLRRSIWAFTSDAGTTSADGGEDGVTQEHVAEHELRELEAMFRRQQRGRVSADSTLATASVDKVAQLAAQTRKNFALLLLEPRRAQNVAIGLTAFRHLSSGGGESGGHGMLRVLQAVCSLSDMDGQLTADLLDQLRVLLPTESEVKRAHLLGPPATPQHPAELFAKASLLFYPELPLRLATFVSICAFPAQVAAAVTRLNAFVDAINVVLSSARLAQLLQRLLVVSHRATDRRLAGTVATGQNSTNYAVPGGDSQAQATLLEQLVKLSQTKAVDGRTSVLEFAVKGLYDRTDGLSLVHCALRDLATLDDPQLKSGTHSELLHDCDSLESLLKRLRDEQQRLQTRRAAMQPMAGVAASHTPVRDAQSQRNLSDFGSPTAQRLCDAYESRLVHQVNLLEASLERLRLQRRRLQQKTRALVDYFGEDPQTVRAPCPIFSALRDLRRDLAFAKESVEWRLQRQQQKQSSQSN